MVYFMVSTSGKRNNSYFTRFIITYRNSLRPILDTYKYLILLIGWITVFVIGYLGFSELNPGESPIDLLAQTLQVLLTPAGNLQFSSSILLNIARAGAMLLFYISIIAIIAHWFCHQLELLWLKIFVRNHIVICGLGHVGSIIVRNIVATRAEPIVVIEMDPTHPEIDWCSQRGIIIIAGNATDRRILDSANISAAEAVYIATGSDENNSAIVAGIYEILRARKDTLHCYVHIIDPNFTNLLRAPQMEVSGTRPISLEFFNIYQIANFCVLDYMPDLLPTLPAPPDRHILVIGLGKMGEGLVIETGKRWMQTYGKNPDKRITVTVIDREAARKKTILETRYPRLRNYCEIIAHSIDLNSPEFFQEDFLFIKGIKPVNAVFLCLSDESLNFSTGLYLNQKLQDTDIPIIIRTIHSTGLARFFSQICRKNTGEYHNIHPFPLVSCSCCIESLIGMNELIARSLHRNYISMRTQEGKTPDNDPAMQPWRTLNTEFREASRSQAANIKRSLNKCGYSIVSRTDWDAPLMEFSQEELENMAEMEHDRWWDERVKRGWKPGPRNLENKTSPYLIPYDQLDERTKGYDRDFVKLYPEILAMVDLSVRKRKPGSGPEEPRLLKFYEPD
jgi:hypothetical protein